MVARQAVWSDPEVTKLLDEFVTVADEVHRLAAGETAECDLFRSFCEEGHYGGRMSPSRTRQGLYCIAPSGKFLASVNTRRPSDVASMLREALERWKEIDPAERTLSQEQIELLEQSERPEDRYPEGGLVLIEYVRDLDRKDSPKDWRGDAWNQDHVWFSKKEARSMLPEPIAVGSRGAVPEALVRRLATLHLVDTVRGQAPPFKEDAVEAAVMEAEIVGIEGGLVQVALTGRTAVVQRGSWATKGYGDRVETSRGVQTELVGRATWNQAEERFTVFDLVATGTRHGATQFNGRYDDLEPNPIGFAFVLAPPNHPRVAPAFWWRYRMQ